MDQFPKTIDAFWHINIDLVSKIPFHLQGDKGKYTSDNEGVLSLMIAENKHYVFDVVCTVHHTAMC